MKKLAMAGLLGLGMLLATSAHADHNSPHGAGWAKMPNDIHNTRIETLGGDNSTFRDFVRSGKGADSVNRYADDTLNGGRSTEAAKQNRDRTMIQSHARMGASRGGMGGSGRR